MRLLTGAPPAGCGDLERFLAALCCRTDAVLEAARRLLEDERAPRRQKLLADLIHNLSGDGAAERRDEDGKWFEGTRFLLLPWNSGNAGWRPGCLVPIRAPALPCFADIDKHCSDPLLAFSSPG